MSTSQLHWFKSSYSSSGEPGDCVEVAVAPSAIHVRDSKTPGAEYVTVSSMTWASFLTHVTK
jgi:hypothetical protein